MRLRSSFVEPRRLSGHDRDQMFALMEKCYENLDRKRFDDDLDNKWLVIEVRDPASEQLVGFSTQVVIDAEVDGQSIQALYSGDTVMSPAHWGDKALANAWGRLALRLIDERGTAPLYWFLTSKGFRTYRYLPLFFRNYAPRAGADVSVADRRLIDALGQLVGGDGYDPVRRILRANRQKYFAQSGAVEPGLRTDHDPHVRFFVEQNPGYARGDELCCVAPLTRENFTPLAYRVIHAANACLPVT